MSGERLLPDPLHRPPEDDAPERPESERPESERPEPQPPWDLEPTERPEPERPQPQPPWELEPTDQPAPSPQSTREQPAEALNDEDEELLAAPTPHVARFQLILGALLGIGAVAVVAALLIGTGPSAAPRADWSPWSPSSDKAGDAAQEIANHVAPSYRLDSGGQLVPITGGPLEIKQLVADGGGKPVVADLPVRLALADQGKLSILDGDGVLYTLCGLGPKCSIDSGLPSPKRDLLLHREALELALYTFRYVRGTDYVVAMLPPTRKGTEPTQAMFFRKGDLQSQLDQPLNATLSSPPPRSSTLNGGDVSSLQALTAGRLFGYEVKPGLDASLLLVLRPFAAG